MLQCLGILEIPLVRTWIEVLMKTLSEMPDQNQVIAKPRGLDELVLDTAVRFLFVGILAQESLHCQCPNVKLVIFQSLLCITPSISCSLQYCVTGLTELETFYLVLTISRLVIPIAV